HEGHLNSLKSVRFHDVLIGAKRDGVPPGPGAERTLPEHLRPGSAEGEPRAAALESPPPADAVPGAKGDDEGGPSREDPGDLQGELPPLLLDPFERILAQQRLPLSAPTPLASASSAAQDLVKRCLVQGEGKSGRVRLEFGSGGLAGSAVELVYDGQLGELRVAVELGDAPPESEIETWRSLAARLRARGLPLAAFDIVPRA